MHRTILFFVLLSTYHNTAWTGETDQTAAIQADDVHDEQLKLYSRKWLTHVVLNKIILNLSISLLLAILTSATNPAVSINPNEFLQRGVAYTLRCGSNAVSFRGAFDANILRRFYFIYTEVHSCHFEDSNSIMNIDLKLHKQKIKIHSCWFYFSFQGTFWTAFRYCMGKTQQLASDESSQDSDRLAKFLLNNYRSLAGKNVWLGGTDAGKRNSWIWLSELSPVGGLTKYLRWNNNEPSSIPGKNMCMVAVLENSEVKWKAQDCETSNCYVCQKYLT